jgi:pantetheine-phosphate adenylyltransferase
LKRLSRAATPRARGGRRLAVYAGTFDPVTRGHLSVIARAARLFDRVWVVVAVNPAKRPLFSVEERVQMLVEVTRRWPRVRCASTDRYVVDFARARGAHYLVRGVRGATDADAEIALANMNRALAPELETVFVPADPELSEVSSSRLKALARQGETELSRYCPPEIVSRLCARVAAEVETGEDREVARG